MKNFILNNWIIISFIALGIIGYSIFIYFNMPILNNLEIGKLIEF